MKHMYIALLLAFICGCGKSPAPSSPHLSDDDLIKGTSVYRRGEENVYEVIPDYIASPPGEFGREGSAGRVFVGIRIEEDRANSIAYLINYAKSKPLGVQEIVVRRRHQSPSKKDQLPSYTVSSSRYTISSKDVVNAVIETGPVEIMTLNRFVDAERSGTALINILQPQPCEIEIKGKDASTRFVFYSERDRILKLITLAERINKSPTLTAALKQKAKPALGLEAALINLPAMVD